MDWVAAQYSGKKAALRSICEAVVALARGLGADVEVVPKKTYVILRRTQQFARIAPVATTSVEVLLVLEGVAPTARLEATFGFNTPLTHRVSVTALEQVDAELGAWLRRAYLRA